MSARLTFAIPFFRRVDWLAEALASVRAQRRADWRCLVLDEQAEPGADALVAKLDDPRITHRANERRLGIVGNGTQPRRRRYELVTLLHADDRSCRLSRRRPRARRRAPRAVAVACDAEIVDASGHAVFSLADAVKRRLVPRGEPWRLAAKRVWRRLRAATS